MCRGLREGANCCHVGPACLVHLESCPPLLTPAPMAVGKKAPRSSKCSAKAPRSSGCTKKAKKPAAGKGFRPVSCGRGFVVSGGMLRKAICVDTVDFDGQSYVKLARGESWLCHAASGKARGLNPLQRTSLISVLLRGSTVPSEASTDSPSPSKHSPSSSGDGMSGLGLDDDISGSGLDDEKPLLQQGSVEKPLLQQGSRTSTPRLPEVIRVPIPSHLRGADRGVQGPEAVRLLSRLPKGALGKQTVLLHVDFVPWAVRCLHDEVKSGGVMFQPEETTLTKPYFSLKDRRWMARGKAPNGDPLDTSTSDRSSGCLWHLSWHLAPAVACGISLASRSIDCLWHLYRHLAPAVCSKQKQHETNTTQQQQH